MPRRFTLRAVRRAGTTLLATMVLAFTALAAAMPGAAASPVHGHHGAISRSLSPQTRFFVPPPDQGAVQETIQLLKSHDFTDAGLIARMEATPKAVWFTS